MQTEKTDIIFFDTEIKHKIGNTNYIVRSFYDDKKENVVEKIKRLLRSEVGREALRPGN